MQRRAAVAGSAVFFLAAPGVVAGLVPWLVTHWQPGHHSVAWLPMRVSGAVVVLGAAAVLVGCFASFALEGRGTPAPLAPTEELVRGGAYRYVRNPMYVCVVSAVLGQAMLLVSAALLVYAVLAWAVMASFVRFYEEPTLQRAHGEQFTRYRDAVPAWLPRLRAWQPPAP